ncbi:glycine betaine ABC transporter substrate-binding protein [Paucilactobacillus suebicus]|uniref:Glycine betaine ABC transporter substrate-binding protein n=1 Tax=Paucilactobacillus suebicus DSM 5007 = KCTC 3549 TaxID=1423807 RepID=A0A0R1W4L2_9LACO|nr:glycine betaine ABC transporter substrate-binding protein [Paucilactobacillus suebicus]KRM10294.1 glycine betaine ABC transporter substrate-binding protein [Paucilactobacillus suebicus DSM 5007 = KCTC 3549]
MNKRLKRILTASLIALFGASTLLSAASPVLADSTVTVGSKNFTENLIIGRIYEDALKHEGIKVKSKLNLSGTFVAQNALKKGSIDLYPEYTGTGYVDVLKHKSTHDDKKVYKTLNSGYAKWNLSWLTPSKANDSQALVITKAASEKYHIKNFSQLAKNAKNLRFASTAEFEGRKDGIPGLKKEYGGFNFKSTSTVDNGVRYKALLDGKADVTVGFTTDGQLDNKKLVLLKDNKDFYPNYYVDAVVRNSTLKSNPKVKTVLNKVNAKLTTKELQKLNAKVDVHHQKYQTVGDQYAKENGFK